MIKPDVLKSLVASIVAAKEDNVVSDFTTENPEMAAAMAKAKERISERRAEALSQVVETCLQGTVTYRNGRKEEIRRLRRLEDRVKEELENLDKAEALFRQGNPLLLLATIGEANVCAIHSELLQSGSKLTLQDIGVLPSGGSW